MKILKKNVFYKIMFFLHKFFIEKITMIKNSGKSIRFLEIGPGEERISDFETVNIVLTKNTDYVLDASKKMPFLSDTFDIIYCSHVLEHTPWYLVDQTIKEWVRILKPGGTLEIWVPDGLKIARAFCDAESGNNDDYKKDGWYRFNEEKDSTKWFSGRMFSYGDGLGTRGHFNFHLSAFSERYLKKVLSNVGLEHIIKMNSNECRGYDHGWINLGVKGVKQIKKE
jgi:ubiquinone/menaquinone biosynthesis C-methylase UbiE